jgi:lipopolysaccharide transport system permease protein
MGKTSGGGRTDTASSSEAPDFRIIRPTRGWRNLDLRELFEYRDLFLFLVWRSLKVRYAQSILGVGWAILQPVAQMVVFTAIFGRLAGIPSEGVPFAVFTYTALLPWTLFSTSLAEATDSLIAQAQMVSKVYFPRILLPLAAVVARLVDFGIAAIVLGGLLAWYGIQPTSAVAAIPLLVVILLAFSAGAGMWLSALAIQYRDVKYAMNFLIQLFMYAAPVVYPVSLVPGELRSLYALNPLVGVIEGLRAGVLGTGPLPWGWIAEGAVVAMIVLVSGTLFFRRKEKVFADVI